MWQNLWVAKKVFCLVSWTKPGAFHQTDSLMSMKAIIMWIGGTKSHMVTMIVQLLHAMIFQREGVIEDHLADIFIQRLFLTLLVDGPVLEKAEKGQKTGKI